jgi:hypothetical protein
VNSGRHRRGTTWLGRFLFPNRSIPLSSRNVPSKGKLRRRRG